MNRKKTIGIIAVAAAAMIIAVCVYLMQLSSTVAGNLMDSVEEISRHDVETIEGSLDDSYARLGSVADRMAVYDVNNVHEAQEQLNLEAASSALFNAIYLLEDDGTLYSSSYVRIDADAHTYDELMADGREHFVMLYDDANGKLETTKESLIFGIRLEPLVIGDRTFVAMLGRSDLSAISNQLVIESFNGEGVSSVVNSQGYYIVSASPATDLDGRDNFYDTLEAGRIEDGVTIQDVRQNIADGKDFVINCVTANGEDLVMSFAPVEGTSWSFIMAVPTEVFDERFAPFITMTAGMLGAMVCVVTIMLALIYRFIKQSMQAQAEAAARTEFLSNMSHEIRTPLNGIIGLNHLMERHLDDREAMAGYVGKLGKAAQYLLSLVNDILDMSKLQAGKVELVHEPFDVRALIDNVCQMQREPMADRGILFDLTTKGLPRPFLVGDEVRISQVLMNILSNAVKFTPPGGTISMNVSQTVVASGRQATTTISIADTGCGMTPEFQAHIFDVFTQERNRNSESQKGTGLGMSISHLLVEQMGGLLKVESVLNEGSCFTMVVTLPIDPAHLDDVPEEAGEVEGLTGGESAAALGGVRASASEGGVTPGGDAPANADAVDAAPNVSVSTGAADTDVRADVPVDAPQEGPVQLLVAEDNELNADIISSILTEEGYAITIAENGEEAVRAFEASPEGFFAAILMDAQMPVMDGYEAAREIRALKRTDAKTVRIFACTASTFTEDRNRALESGMDDFLTKPLNVTVMLQKLQAVKEELS
ncbi:ATP-binding protein [Adlercreutzia equolifaciens]|uniref:hybrid sensor histidine kinase/response regulator n=1 Tax=Adlercreutzia equolifaciens TaxID=446660 RepID=UPI0023AF8B8B|nr:hybrid sensor histidine kinase/response regulator [Adlercreutzia equolifaciens]MDE8702963.1 ATP-binding protein [Adlercreutzia equolifaciens]